MVIGTMVLLGATPAEGQQIQLKGSIGAGFMWEDNPFHLPPGVARRSDVRVTPTLRLEVKRDGPRYGLTLKGRATYDRYRHARELDALQLRADANAYVRITARCLAEAALALDTRRSDPADAALTNRLRTVDTGAGLRCPRVAGLHPALTFRIVDQSNSTRLRSRLDSRTTIAGAALLYSRPSLGMLGATFDYGFIDRPEGVLTSIDIYRAGFRFERSVAARLQGDAGVNYVRLKPRSGTLASYSGAEWRAGIRWLPTPEDVISARIARELRAEGSVAASYAVVTTAGVEASLRVGGRTRLSAQAGQERRDFRGGVDFGGDPPRDRDRTTRAAMQLEYSLTPTLLLDAQVTHARRTAKPSRYDYRSTGAGLRLRYQF